jgi:hypothetical protein
MHGRRSHDAVVQLLPSCKRAGDIVMLDDEDRCVLVFTDADREHAEAGCRRIAALLESSLTVHWRWAVAMFPDDGRGSDALLEVLKTRIRDES